MPKPKRKAKAKNPTNEEKLRSGKQKALQKLWDDFQIQREEYEAHLNRISKETCEKIKKLYEDKLKVLPGNIRDMTLSEYIEAQRKAELEELNVTDLKMITSEFAKSKLASEKKKTLKKNRSERKRSLSASICSSKVMPSNMSRVLSESCLNTPYTKRSMVSSFAITPKFNPKVPLTKGCMRKPRAGEVVLSISGSPLQNFADDVAISLGAGNIIKIADDTEISKLDGDFMKKLDETTKLTLANVKKKLDLILKT